MAKWDVGEGCCQSIKYPSSELEGPERRRAALKSSLGHALILSSKPRVRHRLGVSNARLSAKLLRLVPCDFPSAKRKFKTLVMLDDSSRKRSNDRSAVLAIATGGILAGILDLTQALTLFGRNIPLAIAAGLLGPQAFRGGAATYVLGVFLHFFIALTAAAVYYAVSRRLRFLSQHALVCGLFFGAAVDTFMRLIVLPLSALHA